VSKPIQEQFGERVIQAFAEFARTDLPTPADLEANEFSHVSDASMRRSLAQVFYGTRWIYKLGLALLTKNEERAAHVRAQIVDYGSVAEGLLSYSVAHAIRRGHTKGTDYQWQDPDHKQRQIAWNAASPERQIAYRPFWWLIRIAHDFKIVDGPLQSDLVWLKDERNSVHVRKRASMLQATFLNESKRAFGVVNRTIEQTKTWRALHP
jgi:hypothetical protein